MHHCSIDGQQFVDLLSAIELMGDCLNFISSTSHVILTPAVLVYSIEVNIYAVIQILGLLKKYYHEYFSNILMNKTILKQ